MNKNIYLLIIFFLLVLNVYLKFNKNINENFNDFYKIHVINLEKSKDRWNYIKTQNNGSLNLVKFKAVNGKELNRQNINGLVEKTSYLYKNLEKNRGEIGCALSHLKIWKNFKNTQDEYLIIVEDDVIFEQNFYNKLQKYLKHAPKNWDIIYLGGSHIRGYKVNEHFIKPEPNGRGNLGTYAMLMNRKGVDKLLKYCNPITKSIDHQIKSKFNMINVFYTYPSLIHHNNDMDSDRRILNNQESKASIYWRKYRQSKIEILN